MLGFCVWCVCYYFFKNICWLMVLYVWNFLTIWYHRVTKILQGPPYKLWHPASIVIIIHYYFISFLHLFPAAKPMGLLVLKLLWENHAWVKHYMYIFRISDYTFFKKNFSILFLFNWHNNIYIYKNSRSFTKLSEEKWFLFDLLYVNMKISN